MFNDKVEVKVLRPNEVHSINIGDVNRLFKQEHGGAKRLDAKSLSTYAKNLRIVVALNDDRVVGIGVLLKHDLPSHKFVTVHNWVVSRGFGVPLLVSILDLLIEGVEDAECIEVGALPEDANRIAVLASRGFRHRKKLRYRLKIKKPKK